MSRMRLPLILAASLMASTSFADVPNVAVDIAPVHALVARVMEGVGEPALILPPGASPHEYSLRPSDAAALQEADLVIWIGRDLTPWLEDTIETLSPDAAVTSLLEADGTRLLSFREGALFEAHEQESGEHDHAKDEEHAHDDGHDHAKEEEQALDDGHDHGTHDPHAWLSPTNAANWLNVIAAQLSAADPENAGAYFANAAAGREELDTLMTDVNAQLDPIRSLNFIVFHDAYQYFETDFDLPASGAISLGDATDPSPARIAEIQDRIRNEGVDCVLAEPQYNPALVTTVLDGTDAKTGIMDPLGSSLEPGPDFYPQLIRGLAATLASCR